MPYSKRRYNKRYSRKSRHTRNSKFSKYATYRHRSAKAQANQIYSLNKKLNYIYKQTKPDIQFIDTVNDTKSFPCSTGTGTLDAEEGQVYYVNLMSSTVYVNGEHDNSYTFTSWLSGLSEGSETLRIRNGVAYVSVSKGSDASLWSGKYGYQGPCLVNVYVVQALSNLASITALFNTILSQDDTRGPNFVDSPLAPGTYKYIKILAKRKINLNSINATSKSISIPFKPYIKTWSTDVTYMSGGQDNVQVNHNNIYVVYRVFADSEDSNSHVHLYTKFRLYYTAPGTARPLPSS